jgi:hypothetical protein
MTMRLLYWILILLWVIFGVFGSWFVSYGAYGHYAPIAGSILQLVLFVLLGWKVFGRPIEG